MTAVARIRFSHCARFYIHACVRALVLRREITKIREDLSRGGYFFLLYSGSLRLYICISGKKSVKIRDESVRLEALGEVVLISILAFCSWISNVHARILQ